MATEPMKQENKPSKGKWTKNKKRKAKEVFIYGNYKHYYGYRIDRNANEDPRLAVFTKEWFEGKDCLDIGCNQGNVTIAIAKKFKCRSIVGIDIDKGLIDNAHWNLRKVSMQVNSSKSGTKGSTDNAENPPNDEPNADEEIDLPHVVSFRQENFVEHLQVSSEKYDAIVCLSVSKWIHLNWGDEGIITLFVKIWRLLRPGGVFLLEPQPWSSYKRNRLVSETTKSQFGRIFLHPGKFREILLDKIGFRSAEVITDKLTGTVAGFDRPITAYYK
ncbi:Pre-miRNA 5'-monophosphate methyltransferase [Rhynchospora pubera]|uniref:RNA methyltransferase n=1 Tax=Rhynchospora pubera TaxID=906938 RepID=A0AAV8F3B1_9POAL|nr:Pre-miRNA 5'-monophosphate methyltransferase [Rhynchospora pubera]KAJ4806495.1 Pre-miRNA 5'-monophosphate methyltransferase [Rhynchospora pubera]KAJ4806496.1 Pre-miRNA 5'-monophosphate methyltransferase [Rhynchospora pubera]